MHRFRAHLRSGMSNTRSLTHHGLRQPDQKPVSLRAGPGAGKLTSLCSYPITGSARSTKVPGERDEARLHGIPKGGVWVRQPRCHRRRALRPVALRPCLSAGLPLSRLLSRVSPKPVKACQPCIDINLTLLRLCAPIKKTYVLPTSTQAVGVMKKPRQRMSLRAACAPNGVNI
jgi:hypothetical protein